MTKDLVTVDGARDVAIFDPLKTFDVDQQLAAVIEYCKRVQDWPTLERAVDAKIEEQREFVEWWQRNVSPRQGARTDLSPDLAKGWSMKQIESETRIKNEQVSKWRRALTDELAYAAKLYGAAYRKAMGTDANHRAEGTGENEWYTPKQYIDAARDVMGGIDLDPASSEKAQAVIRADRYYTAKDDGLSHGWAGRVWLNPPYSRDLVPRFVERLIVHVTEGDVSQAILLTHSYTDTAWFHAAEAECRAICFTRGRIGFLSPSGEPAAPTQGQAFFYYGPNVAAFNDWFRQFGFIR